MPMTYAVDDADSPEQTITRIAEIVPRIFSALDKGLLKADSIHVEHDYNPADDRNFYAYCVRREARKLLAADGLTVSLEEDGIREPNMSGLLIHHGYDVIKVRRADQGTVPSVASRPLEAYYKQESLLPGVPSSNLLLLWTSEDGKLVEPARLVRPLWATKGSKKTELDWERPLERFPVVRRAADLDDQFRRRQDEKRKQEGDDTA
jgi:hypothetical protein